MTLTVNDTETESTFVMEVHVTSVNDAPIITIQQVNKRIAVLEDKVYTISPAVTVWDDVTEAYGGVLELTLSVDHGLFSLPRSRYISKLAATSPNPFDGSTLSAYTNPNMKRDSQSYTLFQVIFVLSLFF